MEYISEEPERKVPVMMSWVRRRLDQSDKLFERQKKVASGTEPIWLSLREALKDSIATFEEGRRGGRFEQNGKNHHVYWARYLEDTPNHATEKKKVTIALDGGAGKITATYEGVSHAPRVLKLTLCGEEVCLQREPEEGSKMPDGLHSAEAAFYFLDPFLFPDLASSPLPLELSKEMFGL